MVLDCQPSDIVEATLEHMVVFWVHNWNPIDMLTYKTKSSIDFSRVLKNTKDIKSRQDCN